MRFLQLYVSPFVDNPVSRVSLYEDDATVQSFPSDAHQSMFFGLQLIERVTRALTSGELTRHRDKESLVASTS